VSYLGELCGMLWWPWQFLLEEVPWVLGNAGINATNHQGRTALFEAARRGDALVVSELLTVSVIR
jgi:hypothetical protein